MKNLFLTILIASFTFSGCGPSEEEISKVSIDGSVFIQTQGGQSIKLSLVPIGVSTLEEYEAACDSVLEDIISTAEVYHSLMEENHNLAKTLDQKIETEKAEFYRIRRRLHAFLDKLVGVLVYKSLRKVIPKSGTSDAQAQEIIESANSIIGEANKHANNAQAEADKAEKLEAKNRKMAVDLGLRFDNRTRAVIERLHLSSVKTRSDSDGKFRVELEPEKDYVLTGFGSRKVGDSSETYNWIVKINLSNGESSEAVFFSNSELTSDIPGDESVLDSINSMEHKRFIFSANDAPNSLEEFRLSSF